MQTVDQYSLDSVVAQVGQKVDSRFDHVESFAAEGSVAFGAPLQRGTNPQKQCGTFDGGTFLGIALFDHARENPYQNDNAGGDIPDTMAVSVLRKGAAWVVAAVEVTAGQPAYVTDDGEYTNVPTENTLVGEWSTSTDDDDQLAVLTVNLP